MAFVFKPRVAETSTTTGTGSLTLAGALTGHQSVADTLSVGDTSEFVVVAVDASGNPTGDWEEFLGTYLGSDTLERTTVTNSSNSGSPVFLAVGDKVVLMTPAAARLETATDSAKLGGVAAANYLLASVAASTYLALLGTAYDSARLGGAPAASYLLASTAASTYLTQADAASNYLGIGATAADSAKLGGADAADYLLSATAASTYLGIGATAADSDKLGGTAAASYLLSATAASTYLGISAQAADSAQLGGVAAASYLLSATAASTYLPLAGGTLTGALAFSGTGHAGVRLNNLTTTERDALTPAAGQLVWNTTTGRANIYSGSAWQAGWVRLAGDTMTGALAIASGTLTASAPALDVTQTWNSGATTFAGVRLNVTDTASAAASLLHDWQVGGTTRAALTKAGYLYLTANGSGPFLTPVDATTTGFGAHAGGGNPEISGWVGGTTKLRFRGSYSFVATPLAIATDHANPDLYLYRDAANTLAQRNGTNAQTLRVYRSYTDGSNNSRFMLGWNSTTALLHAEGAGTGSDGSVAFNDAALATNATVGFVMMPSCAGAPTGTPSNIPTGQVPWVYDSTNDKIYVYSGGTWRSTAALS